MGSRGSKCTLILRRFLPERDLEFGVRKQDLLIPLDATELAGAAKRYSLGSSSRTSMQGQATALSSKCTWPSETFKCLNRPLNSRSNSVAGLALKRCIGKDLRGCNQASGHCQEDRRDGRGESGRSLKLSVLLSNGSGIVLAVEADTKVSSSSLNSVAAAECVPLSFPFFRCLPLVFFGSSSFLLLSLEVALLGSCDDWLYV